MATTVISPLHSNKLFIYLFILGERSRPCVSAERKRTRLVSKKSEETFFFLSLSWHCSANVTEQTVSRRGGNGRCWAIKAAKAPDADLIGITDCASKRAGYCGSQQCASRSGLFYVNLCCLRHVILSYVLGSVYPDFAFGCFVTLGKCRARTHRFRVFSVRQQQCRCIPIPNLLSTATVPWVLAFRLDYCFALCRT